MIRKTLSIHKSLGIVGLLATVGSRLVARKARSFPLCKTLLSNRVGLEIGGPSSIFRKGRLLPIYPIVNRLDNCNFADRTIWEGSITSGITFQYDKHKPLGRQFISEATNLNHIKSSTYDFILSSNVLEHIANPLRALHEWIRVLKEKGVLVLIFPHKDCTFDHKRNVTSLSHLIMDYEQETNEDDLTHLPEILEQHDFKKDPGIKGTVAFKKRSENNYENRCLHHHVFNTSLVVEIAHYLNLQIINVEPQLPSHIIVITEKIQAGNFPNNSKYFVNDPKYRRTSPFISDYQ